MKKEIWKPVLDYIGLYEVSNYGRVRSLDRVVKTTKGKRIYKGKLLKPNIGTNGYYYVILSRDGTTETKYIHKLVSNAFLNNPEHLSDVDHINGDKLDNRVENLQFLTHFDNSSKSNKRKNRYDKHLENNPKSKVVIAYKDGKVLEYIDCAKKISNKCNIKYSTLKSKLQKNNCIIDGINYYYEDNIS